MIDYYIEGNREGIIVRIVVVGAGKLGYSISELLSREQYEVVLIDRDAARLEAAKNRLDVLTIMANGSHPQTLQDMDVRGAEVLIAVTESDETNMVICRLAKQAGIRHTVARTSDLAFIEHSKDEIKKTFSIDLLLMPEYIAAREINRILMTPAALNVEDFADGKVRLFETKVHADSKYAGVPLKNLQLPPSILAGMIFRDHRMIIPHGDDCLMPMDNAYFIGNTKDIQKFSENFVRREAHKLERVLIIGAGRTGRSLATMLDRQGVKIKIIDSDRERCRMAAERLSDNSFSICGDGTNIDLLTEESVGDADVVVSLTADDKLNMMMALLSKHLGARETVVRVARSEYNDLMEKVGIDIVISARLLAASEVLAFVRRGGVVSVSLLEGAQAEAVEVIVQERAPVANRPLKEARVPKECLVCAYVRNGETVIPNGDSVLKPGDRAVLFIQPKFSQKVMSYFKRG